MQPNPVKFLQLTSPYWKDYVANWTMMGYNLPPGCDIVPRESKLTEFCEWDALQVPQGMTINVSLSHCQACLPEQGYKWSYAHWIFTTMPGVFGMPGGYANITGVVLSDKKGGSALVEFEDLNAAKMAVTIETGYSENKLRIKPLWEEEKKTDNNVVDGGVGVSDNSGVNRDFESLVMRKLRQEEERKRLIKQMMEEEG